MEHEQAQSSLSDYLDGTLAVEQVEQLESHLETCSECQESLELLQRAIRLVSELPKVEAPPNFERRVRRRARLAGLTHGRSRRRAMKLYTPFASTMVMSVLLAAVGALLVLALLLQQQLELLSVESSQILFLQTDEEVAEVAQITWQAGGEVRVDGKPLQLGSSVGQPASVDLDLPQSAWSTFMTLLGQSRLPGLLTLRKPPINVDGNVRIIILITPELQQPAGQLEPAPMTKPSTPPKEGNEANE